MRGSVIPVVDLRKRFGLLVTAATAQSRVVVVEIGGDDIGVVVDAVAEVLRLPVSSIEVTSTLVTTAESFYIDGIAKVEEQLLILLDLKKALSSEALAKLVLLAEEEAAPDTGGGAEASERTEHAEPAEHAEGAEQDTAALAIDIELLETTFEAVTPRGDELVEYFYEQLFERYPDVQSLFAEVDMSEQRAKLLTALVTVVASLRRPEELAGHLEALGRRHAGYRALPEHYAAVGEVLLDIRAGREAAFSRLPELDEAALAQQVQTVFSRGGEVALADWLMVATRHYSAHLDGVEAALDGGDG